ncbi:gastrula zinc finger protein XlCGF8.2DB-like [Penaeus chinensis]|uniref:gastrula zinc finger protein XlCGF8.2DB-like n=1 Tax=Penaeus chinensis TaxID=139456 RepID=UPI001FB5F6A8|nr:gastrula zinc finger protein XlCGF8.2DB-like [Penaeus chinensis]XP_047497471.1 gastrula zinc finger protein XlCGF8.2DB-like [Penaeus chinensis]
MWETIEGNETNAVTLGKQAEGSENWESVENTKDIKEETDILKQLWACADIAEGEKLADVSGGTKQEVLPEQEWQSTSHNNMEITIEAVQKEMQLKASASGGDVVGSKNTAKKTEIHQCSECGKKFDNKFQLESHIFSHTGEPPFECVDCGKIFQQQYALKNHLLIHKKTFACTVCGKRLLNYQNLARHIQTHSEEKPHKCSVCGRGFVRNLMLRNICVLMLD